jgi:hypothetical protein
MCNSINYNVIFMDEIHFNVMTMILILLLNDKEIFILLLWHECVWSCEFKYLHEGQKGNTNTIWYQTLFYTDENTNKLYITYEYTDGMCSLVYSSDYKNCSPSS